MCKKGKLFTNSRVMHHLFPSLGSMVVSLTGHQTPTATACQGPVQSFDVKFTAVFILYINKQRLRGNDTKAVQIVRSQHAIQVQKISFKRLFIAYPLKVSFFNLFILIRG